MDRTPMIHSQAGEGITH